MTTAPSPSRKDKSESKRDRFKRLAAARTSAVLRKLKVLGNCANRAAYEYSQDEIRKIFAAIEGKLKEIKARFLETAAEDEFKL